MALISLGESECPLCGETLADASFVCFPFLEFCDAETRKLSDSGAHFACIRRHPNRRAWEDVYRNCFGADGVDADGSRVSSPTESVRVLVDGRSIRLCHAPTFLILRMPLRAAQNWLAASFWQDVESRNGASFEDQGIEFSVNRLGGATQLDLRVGPWACTPRTCADAGLVQEARRVVDDSEAQACVRELRTGLASALQELA